MPSRRLPQTDDQRSAALHAINQKYQATSAGARLISTDQFTALGSIFSPWRAARTESGRLLALQTEATKDSEKAFARCVKHNSHFIQNLNHAIEREVLPASVRAFYQLPTSHAEVPEMNSTADALQWAGKLADGEGQRLTAGGAALSWPTIAEVNSASSALGTSQNDQSEAKDAFDLAQEAVDAQRPDVDALIKDLWDTIEYALRNEAPSSLRRKAREWGVFYEGAEEEAEEEGGGGGGGGGGGTPPPGP